ncbi:translation elongation factor Ts [Sedimentisphaera salicampi]|uniref:Elongation factor Ts n=1 Tax=Sedimentisphaera salicampi TaxID=1941349 RepID=A0A1W6LKN5_9BACT|nr:translation elongation factor Ts [Sedimentisphaera salicampi]ARN56312.1 Elongation factor Ts [Sedimentisphaera salicampi]OXU15594.1 Elongation factor Ts [Sedimentisphaera salicampi]
MAEINASDVMKLRKMSGQGMMDCKKALAETNGDLDEAMTLLRKKGLATMAKRADRSASEGKVTVKSSGKDTVLTSLCCETDFVAKNDDFKEVADKVADAALQAAPGSKLAEQEIEGKKVSELITELVSKTGEKTEIGDWAKMSEEENTVVGSYVHFNNKMGALVKIVCENPSEKLQKLADEVCMHIAAVKPMALNKESFDQEVIEKEREIAKEQMKDKPAQIIEKIVEGKINKMISENCLVNQKFVKNEEMTVEEAVKDAGGSKIAAFERVAIG